MLCFVTNKKEKAASAVNQFKEVAGNEKILVVAPDEIIDEIPCDYKAPEKNFKENHPETVFQGAYGGNRNVALAACHALKTNAIFFDDDVSPVQNPVKKHLQLLQENPAVFGKYVGQAAGTLSCLLKLVQEYSKEEPNPEKAAQYSSNIPEDTRTPRTGIVGGNTSVRLDAIPKQCFYPTSYRVEDALYYGLAAHHGFECLDTFEAIVEHEKTGRVGDLAKALENEVAGGSIARCISELTLKKESPEKAVEIKQQCFDAAWNYYSVEYAQKKLPENEYTKAIHEITPEKLLLPDNEFVEQTKKFFDSQKEWRPALQKVRAGEFEC